MKNVSHITHITIQQVTIAVMILIILGISSLVLYEGPRFGAPPPLEGTASGSPAPTTHPPTGRTWFWDRSLWQNPAPPTP